MTSDITSQSILPWVRVGLEDVQMEADSLNALLSCIANNKKKAATGYISYEFDTWTLDQSGSFDTDVLDELAQAKNFQALYFWDCYMSTEMTI